MLQGNLAGARGTGRARAQGDVAAGVAVVGRVGDTIHARPGVVRLAIGDAGAEVVGVRGAVVPGGAGVAAGGVGLGDGGEREGEGLELGEENDIREHLRSSGIDRGES